MIVSFKLMEGTIHGTTSLQECGLENEENAEYCME